LTLDTSLLSAQAYTVGLTYSGDFYESSTKNLYIDVLERVTLLNGNRDLVTQLVRTIYIGDEYNFTFSYVDRDLNANITNLRTQSYSWGEYSSSLTIDANNNYVLDFDTETRPIGTYSITVTLDKKNYKIKIATISLRIILREFDYELGDEFEDKQVSVVKGNKVTLTIELTDPTKGNTPLTGATVILEIGNDERDFDEVEPGVYELEFDTDDYEAFFESNVLTGTIKISKADYISDEVDITIVVEIEEITPGIPTFYFLIIIGVIMAVMGALITYKVIQISKIPKFVKRTRKLKKMIKSGAEISEDILYPSKKDSK